MALFFFVGYRGFKKCRASFLLEQSQPMLCIILHNLNLRAQSKEPLVLNPNATCFEESPCKLDQTSN